MEKRVSIEGIDNLELAIYQVLSIEDKVEQTKELELCKIEAKKAGVPVAYFNQQVKNLIQQQKEVARNATETICIDQKQYELPPGYSIFDNAIYYDGETGSEEVCHHPVAIKAKAENIDTGATKLQLVWQRDGNQERSVFVDAEVAANKSDIIKLANQNLDITSINARGFVRFPRDYQYYHEGEIPQIKSVGRCGWLKLDASDEATEIFAPYSEKMYFDGEDKAGDLFRAVNKGKGNLETICKAFTKWRKENRIVKLVIAASCASVLIKKVGGLPFVVHLWGGTEIGKTVLLWTAASVWGEHKEYVKTFNSTQIGLEQLCVFLNNLPLILDELQIKKGSRDYDNLIYSLTEGSGRTRSQKTGGLQVSESWCNTVITNGEMPITRAHSGGGVLNRIIEIECPEEQLFEDSDEALETINEHYGLIGREFVKVVESIPEDKLKQRYKQILEGLRRDGTRTEKQYRSAAFIVLADELLAENILGDEAIDDEITNDEILRFLSKAEEVDVNKRAYNYLMDQIGMNMNRFYEGDYEVWGKIEFDTKTVVIIGSQFNRIMDEGGYNPTAFKRWLRDHDLVRLDSEGNYSIPVRVNKIRPRCICLKNVDLEEVQRM